LRVLALEYPGGNQHTPLFRPTPSIANDGFPVAVANAVLLVIAGFLLAGTALPAQAQELGKLRQITGPSPSGQPGINYPGTEIEPRIDANPTDPRNLIAGWQQDRCSDGGARGDVSAYTDDGGISWKTVLVPNTTRCTGHMLQVTEGSIYYNDIDTWGGSSGSRGHFKP